MGRDRRPRPPAAAGPHPRGWRRRRERTRPRLAQITRQGIAKHLAVLERAGLVEAARTGREIRFTVRPDRLDPATRQMAQLVAEWDQRQAMIKRIAETERHPQH